jgi:hypothetical protein
VEGSGLLLLSLRRIFRQNGIRFQSHKFVAASKRCLSDAVMFRIVMESELSHLGGS